MSLYQSPASEIQTDSAQYLFRVFHTPITATTFNRHLVAERHTGAGVYGLGDSRVLNYNDYLFSLPMTSEKIIEAGSRLAHAESVLYINSRIHFIAVFMVEANRPISASTPCCVLHPWNSTELRSSQDFVLDYRPARISDNFAVSRASHGWIYTNSVEEGSFASYDLIGSNAGFGILDSFITLDVARECAKGACRHQQFFAVLGLGDYYFDFKGNLHLTECGALMRCRFPLYQEILRGLEYSHCGYKLRTDGSVERSTVALNNRVANLAIDAAQDRRFFAFQSRELSELYRVFYELCLNVGQLLRQHEIAGFSEIHYIPENRFGTHPALPYTKVNLEYLNLALTKIAYFVNYVAIACGSNTLLIASPDMNDAAMEMLFYGFVQHISLPDESTGMVLNPIAEYADSTSWSVLLSMADLLGSVWNKMRINYRNGQAFAVNANGEIAPSNLQEAFAFIEAQNLEASQFEEMQGDVLALYNLMFVWQFTFKPVRPTRNPAGNDDYKTAKIEKAARHQMQKDHDSACLNISFPRDWDRFNNTLPLFSQYAIWTPYIVPFDADSTLAQINLNALIAEFEALIRERNEAARQAAANRARERADEQAARQAEAAARAGANPLDVWDWRNWSNKDWWLTPVAVNDIPAFVGYAADTPSEIDAINDILHFPKKTVQITKRVELVIDAVRVLLVPETVLRDVLKTPQFRHLLKDVREQSEGHWKAKIEGAVKRHVLDDLEGTAPQYEARQFWPPLPPP